MWWEGQAGSWTTAAGLAAVGSGQVSGKVGVAWQAGGWWRNRAQREASGVRSTSFWLWILADWCLSGPVSSSVQKPSFPHSEFGEVAVPGLTLDMWGRSP